MCCADLFLAVIAILFPPIAVWIKSGLCTADSLINIALCCLGYLPGLLHAWYIIARNPERDYDYEPIADAEAGRGGDRVTYYYVSHTQAGPPRDGYGTQVAGLGQPPQPVNKATKPAAAPQPAPPADEGAVLAGPSVGAGEGEGAPPSYSEVVKGDHKIQSDD